jgi:LEA14-like dessication related protein
MNRQNVLRDMSLLAMAFVLTACAGMETVISAPGVSLRNVTVTGLDFSGQTFLLGFDVVNPNPFPLPVSEISYGIELDGHQFAGGETAAGFVIPAQGDGEFAISVQLNLLKTAPQLLYVLRDGVRGDISYALKGKLAIDMPLVKPVGFKSTGEIRLQTSNSRASK